jgi:hypothetical protein
MRQVCGECLHGVPDHWPACSQAEPTPPQPEVAGYITCIYYSAPHPRWGEPGRCTANVHFDNGQEMSIPISHAQYGYLAQTLSEHRPPRVRVTIEPWASPCQGENGEP